MLVTYDIFTAFSTSFSFDMYLRGSLVFFLRLFIHIVLLVRDCINYLGSQLYLHRIGRIYICFALTVYTQSHGAVSRDIRLWLLPRAVFTRPFAPLNWHWSNECRREIHIDMACEMHRS